MASKIDIANMALSLVGATPITAFTDSSPQDSVSSLFYDTAKAATLRAGKWHFAQAIVALTSAGFAASFGFGYESSLRAECLRVNAVSDTDYEYKIDARSIVTYNTSLKILYTRDVAEGDMDPLFVLAFSSRLAVELAVPLTKDLAMEKAMLELYAIRLKEATGADATEGSGDRFVSDELVDVRF